MLERWAVAAIVLTGALAAGCATTSAPEHQSQIDPGANFAAYETYGWKDATGEGVSDQPMRMLDGNIRDAVDAELVRRGYRKVDTSPNLYITYETAAADKAKSSPFRVGIGVGSYGSGGGGSVGMSSSGVQNYREGKLVIHAIDTAANREVWYGTVSGQVSKKGIDAEGVARAVGIAMQDFPSKTASAPAP